MSKKHTYSDAAREAMSDGASLNGLLAAGATVSNPTYNAYTAGDVLLWSVPLHVTTPMVYQSGGDSYFVRPSGLFTGHAPVGVATGTTAKFDIKGRDDVTHISGTAGLTGSDNGLEMGNLAVVNTEAIPVPFSAEPIHRIVNPA